jgi:hypothetical protein
VLTQPAGIPAVYFFATLLGLGMAERALLKKKLKVKHLVTVGA